MIDWQLNGEKFDVIVADPPWRYDHTSCPDKRDEIERHYSTLTLEAVKAIPLRNICADNCILFLWSPAPKLSEALELLEAWGFRYLTCAIWDKKIIGLGYWFRQQHEILLLGVRGKPKTPLPGARHSSVFCEQRTVHSRKPDCVKRAIRTMFPQARIIELFAREKMTGDDNWIVWGNESDGIGDMPLFAKGKE